MKQGALNTGPGALRRMATLAAAAGLGMGLVACGGSDDSAAVVAPPAPASTQLAGIAAVGAPIANGAVQVRCAGATSAVLQTTTSATGAWQVNTTGQALPCAARVSGGNLPAGQALHSVALEFGTLNLTPLTDLIVANATGRAPGLWWGSTGPADLASFSAPGVSQALNQVRSALGLAPLQTLDPRTVAFTATPKDAVDAMLEALQKALATSGLTYASLLGEASKAAFTLSDSFRATIKTAYNTITVGNPGAGPGVDVDVDTGPGTGTGPGTSGNYTLTLNVVASGMALPPVTITNLPKPATQSEFCDDINSASSGIGLNQSIPAGTGTLKINSCSFNGTVGQVSATVSLTSPVSLNVPYTVTYTYR